MKRYFLICLVLISVLSFGQRKEYNKAGKLLLNKEYAAANEIIEKILVDYNIDKLDIELKYYILTVASDSNYYLNNYEKALNYYIELKKIVVDGKIEVQDKKTFVSRIDKLTEELQGKIKKEGIISENNSNDNTSASLDNGTKLVASKSMSDDKTVTLTVTGTGKTIEEAKQNALRSAIEQAFGTFISSKTEILNDNLVKDEIVSIANGNIQKFDVISEVQIPEIGYATTLKATVSVTKLTSFVESKGVIVEFKGSLFSFNIKQQIFNEKNEIKAITDMCDVTKKIADASFNFLIKANEPIAVNGNNEQWSIPITIGIQPNKNFFTSINYIFNTLKALTLTKEEANDYKKLGKKIYPVSFAISEDKYDYFILRTAESIKYLIDQIYYFNNAMINFKISNGLVDIDLKDYYKTSFCIYGGEAIRSPPKDADKFELRIQDIKFRPIRFDSQSCDLYPSLFKRHCCPDNKSIPCFNYKNLYDKDIEYYLQHYGVRVFTGKFSFVDNLNMSLKIVDNQNGLLISFIGVSEDEELVVLNLKDDKSLDEINKITEYKISKK